jgi:hypothetical protein
MKTSLKILHWSPRILSILLILFLALFALDAFEPGKSFPQEMLSLFMGLIPALLLVVVAIIAWKWELIGGTLFILLALGYALFAMNHLMWIVGISLPLIVEGILFIWCFLAKKKALKVAK